MGHPSSAKRPARKRRSGSRSALCRACRYAAIASSRRPRRRRRSPRTAGSHVVAVEPAALFDRLDQLEGPFGPVDHRHGHGVVELDDRGRGGCASTPRTTRRFAANRCPRSAPRAGAAPRSRPGSRRCPAAPRRRSAASTRFRPSAICALSHRERSCDLSRMASPSGVVRASRRASCRSMSASKALASAGSASARRAAARAGSPRGKARRG